MTEYPKESRNTLVFIRGEEACSRRSGGETKGDGTRHGGSGEVTKHRRFGSGGRYFCAWNKLLRRRKCKTNPSLVNSALFRLNYLLI